MKRLFLILAITGMMVSCNDSETSEEIPATDSTRLPSTVSPADTSTIRVDTPARPADTVIKK